MKEKRRMRKRLPVIFAMAAAAAFLWSSCGNSSSYNTKGMSSSSSVAYDSGAGYDSDYETGVPEEAAYEGGEIDLSTDLHPDKSRKIIYTADVSVETEQFEAAVSTIRDLLDNAGGYVSSTSQWGSSSDGSRRSSYTCRVPSEHYREFISGLSGAGNVYSLNEYTDDVTTEYVDVQARLDSLNVQKGRLEELAAEAEDIEVLLSIEDKLSEVLYQIESYTAQMRTFDNQIFYSTVTIELREVGKISEGTTFGNRVRAAFSGSWESFVDGVQGFTIWLIYALPGLIIAAVIVLIVIFCIRRHRKRSGTTSVYPEQRKPYHAQWKTPSTDKTSDSATPEAEQTDLKE